MGVAAGRGEPHPVERLFAGLEHTLPAEVEEREVVLGVGEATVNELRRGLVHDRFSSRTPQCRMSSKTVIMTIGNFLGNCLGNFLGHFLRNFL